jgi:mRNA degradation ribonuclease J1/J2
VLAEPEVIVRGFDAPDDEGAVLVEQAKLVVARVLAEGEEHQITEQHLVQQQLHDSLAEMVLRMTGKRPMVLPVVVEV